MDITIRPGLLSGTVNVIPSKSQAHRYLICAAFADGSTTILCPETSRDMDATADCLRALGAGIEKNAEGYIVTPISRTPETAILPCRDSGSTLRFLLPVVGALGVDSTFLMEGRLPQRPLSPLWEEMERMGCVLTRPTPDTVRCTGKLKPGNYSIPGNVSSQYITGLLFALSLLDQPGSLKVTGKTESKPYIELTKAAMQTFGVNSDSPEPQAYHTPGKVKVEGDWSNGAFWIGAKMLGSSLAVKGLNPHSTQGDRVAEGLLRIIATAAGAPIQRVEDIPDLVPILSVVAAANQGAVFTHIQRLRLKESDRVESTVAMIRALGGRAEATEDTLNIYGTGLTGGSVDSANDHRIAMSAAIAATVCTQPVEIRGAECVEKSYPRFWEEYARLGGRYE